MATRKRASGKRAPQKPGQTGSEARLRQTIDLMVRQAWGPSIRDKMAKKWKVDHSVVDRTAAEASRFIKLHMEESQKDVRERILASIQLVAEQAIKDKKYAPAIKALELQSRIHGIAQPEEHHHTFEGFSDDDLLAALKSPDPQAETALPETTIQ